MKPILEAIHFGQNQTIMGFRYAKKNFETPWHLHPQHELTYIESSVGTKFIGDYVGLYEPGELVLLRANLPHCWKNNLDQEKESKSIVVQWNRGVFPQVPELKKVFDLLKTASRGVAFDKDEIKPLLSSIKKIPKLTGHDLYVQLLVLLVALSKCQQRTLSAASFKEDFPTLYGDRMAKVHNFVSVNYHRKIYLKELALLVNMSQQSFSRFFTKMMGRSFFVFLNEYRINMAVRFLLDTRETVSEIAFRCGYESLPFFFKKFGEAHGISPQKYRQRFTRN